MTNNPRIYLWIALALLVWLNYDAWMKDYGPKPGLINAPSAQTGATPGGGTAGDLSSRIPQASKADQTGSAQGQVPTAAGAVPPTAAPGEPAADATAAAQVVHVRTDVRF